MVFPFYEKCIELGVKNMHFHKGPAVEPLRLEHFDVRDLDEPAWLYPELNFIVDHVGLPRLDDFCWMAARCPNIYSSLAVALAFIHNQPRFFANVMANLLFWIGPDRIIYGTDFPIWHPHWQLDDFMAMELPDDLKEEYKVDLTPESKHKIVGGNIARLYGIDIERTLTQIEDDEFAQRRKAYLASQPATETGGGGEVAPWAAAIRRARGGAGALPARPPAARFTVTGRLARAAFTGTGGCGAWRRRWRRAAAPRRGFAPRSPASSGFGS